MTGSVLTDAQVRQMGIGTWRFNDKEGSVDVSLLGDGTFRTHRYIKTMSNFQVLFMPTPISAGNWTVANGRLQLAVTSSTRADKVNQRFNMSVRSISGSDVILVDDLGRVARAVRTQ